MVPARPEEKEYDLIYVQEAIDLSEHDRESLITRLRNGVLPFQQIRTKRTVRAHAAEIRRLWGDERFEFTVADHDAEDRATLLETGIATIGANKAVRPGIEAVQERLKDAGDGRARPFVLRDSLVARDPLLDD